MIGPPPMSEPLVSASVNDPKNTSVLAAVPEAMTSVMPSVADTTV